MRVRSLTENRVVIEFDFEDAEFIGMEMPPGDGWTADWWTHVWRPMLVLRGDEDVQP